MTACRADGRKKFFTKYMKISTVILYENCPLGQHGACTPVLCVQTELGQELFRGTPKASGSPPFFRI